MDYGPTLTHTYQVSRKPLNIAYKGVAIRLDPGQGGIARGKMWTIFEECLEQIDFLGAQVGFREIELKRLRAQNERQVAMIDNLEKTLWKKK
jgi:hypothetical protein